MISQYVRHDQTPLDSPLELADCPQNSAHAAALRCQLFASLGPTQCHSCPACGQQNQQAQLALSSIYTHPLSLSLVLALSLSTLSSTQSKRRRRKGRGRGGDWRSPAAAHHHEDHLGAAVHKRWGLEEGGALSSSPFGARRRRNQEEEEELELPREGSSTSIILGSLDPSFAALGKDSIKPKLISCFS